MTSAAPLLHYIDFGPKDAQPVIFLGSIASSVDMWRLQLDELSRDFRVIAVDHRGHGSSPNSDVAPGETSLDDLAQDVLAVADAAGVDSFAVVGLSLGGAIAQYLAATSSRVTKAVFMCTAHYFGGPDKWNPRAELTRAEGMAPMEEGVISLWLTPEFAAQHPATERALRDMILSTTGEGYASCSDALAKWDFGEQLKNITVPVLTIAGAHDESTPPATVHAIAEKVSGPAQTLTLSSGAHVPTVELPEEVNAALRDFLRQGQ